jgi:hypothetical protein
MCIINAIEDAERPNVVTTSPPTNDLTRASQLLCSQHLDGQAFSWSISRTAFNQNIIHKTLSAPLPLRQYVPLHANSMKNIPKISGI